MKAVGLLFAFSFVASNVRIFNFDAGPLGKTPPGWSVAMTNGGSAPPQWEILKDHTAPTQPYVLAQVSRNEPSDHYPLAIVDGLTLRDGDLSVRMKLVAGREKQAGGLVWRYRDDKNYYLVRANALDNEVSLIKVENGRRIPLLSGAKHQMHPNEWSILKVSVRGDRFQVYCDHRRILEGRDRTFAGPGKVGLCTVGDSVTYVDDFRVSPR